ncbi:hypothetical protein D3C85_1581030 [compost metagenome]
MGLGEALVQMAIAGLHHQLAATGHGVPCIDHQVEQGTFQLIGVGFGHPQLLAQLHVQLNAFVDTALQQLAHGHHQAVHLHRF